MLKSTIICCSLMVLVANLPLARADEEQKNPRKGKAILSQLISELDSCAQSVNVSLPSNGALTEEKKAALVACIVENKKAKKEAFKACLEKEGIKFGEHNRGKGKESGERDSERGEGRQWKGRGRERSEHGGREGRESGRKHGQERQIDPDLKAKIEACKNPAKSSLEALEMEE